MPSVLCVDVGSTFTKGVLVDAGTGDVLGTASSPTTVTTDVMDGVDAVRSALAGHGEPDGVLVCSSAGGGLRLAVVGVACSLAFAAQAHNAWLMPSSTVLSAPQWVTVDAAVTTDPFVFDHNALGVEKVAVTAPDPTFSISAATEDAWQSRVQ